MKKSSLSLVVMATILFVGASSTAQISTKWANDSAATIEKGRWEVGLFGALHYGISEDVELSTHPLWMFLIPNMSAKIAWTESQRWQFASRHEVVYPTLFLQTLSRDGAGGVLPSTTQVPHIVSLKNDAIWSLFLLQNHVLSTMVGIHTSARFGANNLPQIELPLVYARTAAYHSPLTARIGVYADGPLLDRLDYFVGVDVFLMPWLSGNYMVEHSGQIGWTISPGLRTMLGYKAVYGDYPYGDSFDILPMVDVVWGWN